MRSFCRSICITAALALCSAISLSAQAVEYVVLRPLGSLLTEGVNTLAKFKVDLAHMQAGREEVVKADSSLQSESNGFRQASATSNTPTFFPGTKMILQHSR